MQTGSAVRRLAAAGAAVLALSITADALASPPAVQNGTYNGVVATGYQCLGRSGQQRCTATLAVNGKRGRQALMLGGLQFDDHCNDGSGLGSRSTSIAPNRTFPISARGTFKLVIQNTSSTGTNLQHETLTMSGTFKPRKGRR